MKSLFLHVIALLLVSVTYSQTTYTWIGPNNGSWATGSNWSPTRSSTNTSDILRFNDGTTKTIMSVPTQTISRLLVTANTTITLNSASNNRTLTINNGTGTDFTIDAGSSLTIAANNNNFKVSLNTNATADISGTLRVSSGQTYSTNAAGNNTDVSTTGIIQNTGTVTCTNAGKLTMSAGASYLHTQNGGTIPTADWNASAGCTITGITNTVPGGLNQSFGNFTWNCAAQSANLTFNGNFTTVDGNLTIAETNGRRLYMGTNDNVSLDIAGDLIIGSAGNTAIFDMDSNNGSITINIAGDLTTLGSGQIDNSGNNNAAFNFNKASGTQIINFGNSTPFGALWGGSINFGTGSSTNKVVLQTNMPMASTYMTTITVLNGSSLDLGTSVISNTASFTANTGSALWIGSPTGISSSGATGNIQVTSTRTFNPNVDYGYNGTTAQITGNGLPASLSRLILDNTSGVGTTAGVTLSQSTAIANELVLTNGALKTSATNMLTVNAGAIATPTNNSFVAGPMRKTGNTAFTFPTGWLGASGGRIPIGMSALSGSATVQAEYKRLPASTVGTAVTTPVNHASACEYWELYPTTGSITTTVTMYWNTYSNCSAVAYVTSFASLIVARSNGTTWTSAGNTGGSLGSGNIVSNAGTTINNTTPFKYFSLASTAAGVNPLPVLFNDVKAFERNNDVQIEWTNLTEKDILLYTVQRSVNGRDFSTIASRLPVSNQSDKASYMDIDASPVQSANYYRIKATETGGKEIYSKIIRVDIGAVKAAVSVYPNPVVNKELTVSLTGITKGTYQLIFINSMGQQVYRTTMQTPGNAFTQTIALPATIKAGVYSLLVSGSVYTDAKTFIVP